MPNRSSFREVAVGLFIVAAIAGLLGLLGMASSGPGYLSSNRTIDVIFNDGQGIRVGSAVRIAGIDAGRVSDIDLTEIDGTLRAKLKISLPVRLAKKLRQDVKITIQESLAGSSRVNIVSSGKSAVALVPGQVIQGVESNFFDPILEQVGMGPVERSHISHTIAEVRETIDSVGPRIKLIMGTFQDTAAGLREAADTIRPAVESTAGNIQELSKRIAAAGPGVESALKRLDTITEVAEGVLSENRPNIKATVASVRDLTATAQDVAAKNRAKVEAVVDGLNNIRGRAERLLYQADQLAGQGLQIVTRNRADLERTVANVRDATDWASKLVQKIYANPFYLSPLYKPGPEDLRASTAYDTAQVFTKGAQELTDLVKTLDAMSANASTPEQRKQIAQLHQSINEVTNRLGATAGSLAEALKPAQRTAARGMRNARQQ
ncbi:MlaD family protein [Singulisphaera sp. PoT]|uniref:MlaD family protein n=1 Tax=Singulisphaera sp. PoT TaxID=3411797 RepID=UPI003BF481D0